MSFSLLQVKQMDRFDAEAINHKELLKNEMAEKREERGLNETMSINKMMMKIKRLTQRELEKRKKSLYGPIWIVRMFIHL